MKNWKQRLRKKRVWLAIASALLMVLQALGMDIMEEQYNEIVNAVLTVFVLLGIVEGD